MRGTCSGEDQGGGVEQTAEFVYFGFFAAFPVWQSHCGTQRHLSRVPEGRAELREGDRWPLCSPEATMPSILVKRQEHPPRKAPRDKPLTSSRGQQTVACLGLEVHKSQPKSERSDRLK